MGDEKKDQEQVKMTFWNVCGWTDTDGGEVNRGVRVDDMRARVLEYYQPDVVALAETWLRGKEGVRVKGYQWYGRNRRCVSRKAVRGSGGVGFLIKETCLRQYEVEILDDEVEDVLWIRMQDRSGVNDDLTVAVCYLPPEASSHGGGVESMLLSLAEQVEKYRSTGRMLICGEMWGLTGDFEDGMGSSAHG